MDHAGGHCGWGRGDAAGRSDRLPSTMCFALLLSKGRMPFLEARLADDSGVGPEDWRSRGHP